MPSPRRFEIDLSSYGYHMEVDVKKSDCCRGEAPHWHLWHGRSRAGSISANGVWIEKPSVDHHIMKEAEELTSRYSSSIVEVYNHNKIYGADD